LTTAMRALFAAATREVTILPAQRWSRTGPLSAVDSGTESVCVCVCLCRVFGRRGLPGHDEKEERREARSHRAHHRY